MNAAGWVLAAILAVALVLCMGRLFKFQREARRLSAEIQAFLEKPNHVPPFSVEDDSFAPFRNEVVDLMTRLCQSRESALAERAHNQAFLLDVSHQLKTPIAGLRLYTELDASPRRDKQLQLLSRMEISLHSLLKLEKLQAGGYALDFQTVNLRAVALDACAEMGALFPEKHIRCEGDASVRCDAHWICEALINLIKNACEHTEANGHVSIRLHQDKCEAMITVTDDGGGVPEEMLPKLFDRFFRARPDAPNAHQNVGLGLSIVKTMACRKNRTTNGAAK